MIELGIGHSFFKKYLTIRPSEGIVFEVIGKYHKDDEKQKPSDDSQKKPKQRKIDKKDSQIYNKKLLRYIDKNISPKREQQDIVGMHEVEHITEEIEKGKVKR